jgi:hypothetical protein
MRHEIPGCRIIRTMRGEGHPITLVGFSTYPAGKGTIASMLRKSWIERRVDPAGVVQFRITQAGKAALKVKIPTSR